MTVRVRPLTEVDRAWVVDAAPDLWGSNVVVAHGEVFEPATLEGFVAEDGGVRAGLLTYRADDDACQRKQVATVERGRQPHGIRLMGSGS